LGIYDGPVPRFAKRYHDLRSEMVAAVAQYTEEVRRREFPGPEHAYSIDEAELEEFRQALARL
jgi:3-methyl-2-oxobutanoate hydroxymethyltransferase